MHVDIVMLKQERDKDKLLTHRWNNTVYIVHVNYCVYM